ncbi:hypothetical protein V9K67_25520 [Paraflavisolibacter sp. H34]|uniref:hypothetical protein n=1 Tax=Huijunlia imazamoxiresistens TaxID=3127457 RepID=UPI0030180433
MKKILAMALLGSALWACGGNDDKGTGDDHQHNMGTVDESINNTPTNESMIGDSTANTNIYNTDSPSGKGTVYDTAARR